MTPPPPVRAMLPKPVENRQAPKTAVTKPSITPKQLIKKPEVKKEPELKPTETKIVRAEPTQY